VNNQTKKFGPRTREERLRLNHGQRKAAVRQMVEAHCRHEVIGEVQNTIARELAALSEVPQTVPARIADLLRELHKRLRADSERS